jgi:hypothetical protein
MPSQLRRETREHRKLLRTEPRSTVSELLTESRLRGGRPGERPPPQFGRPAPHRLLPAEAGRNMAAPLPRVPPREQRRRGSASTGAPRPGPRRAEAASTALCSPAGRRPPALPPPINPQGDSRRASARPGHKGDRSPLSLSERAAAPGPHTSSPPEAGLRDSCASLVPRQRPGPAASHVPPAAARAPPRSPARRPSTPHPGPAPTRQRPDPGGGFLLLRQH